MVGSEQWITDLTLVKSLAKHADDVALQQRWMGVKLDNKKRLAALIKKLTGATVSTDALFDIQVRRSVRDGFRCDFLPCPAHVLILRVRSVAKNASVIVNEPHTTSSWFTGLRSESGS